ncbi:hypothetical protein FIBSPDRAFT_894021 [Athelia psychrophila]|uniref:Uncharacterized protein n=1 Tax=Athelia psychrophila TaxID=1759441 RepID=A0A166GFI6_9AGAM|nr:hypothetical protein FIBSPDRAFT_894021 [Fibularhizoctonia sp. CBS 109695]
MKHLGSLPDMLDFLCHDFICMTCHVDKLGNTPYHAFYGLDSNHKDLHSWVPALPIPITLSVEYSLSMSAHVSSASTLILHFYLQGLKNRTLLPYLLELALQEYIPLVSLQMIDQEYNFDKHTANVNKWVEDVFSYNRVVVFITTHAHDETGDHSGGPGFSSDPYNVLNGLFPKPLHQAFKDRTAFDLTSNPRVHAHEAIAFLSLGLIPSLTNGFWLNFAFRVIIEGTSLGDALPYMLSATSMSQYVRHTNLLYVKIPDSNTKPVICSEYVWTHPDSGHSDDGSLPTGLNVDASTAMEAQSGLPPSPEADTYSFARVSLLKAINPIDGFNQGIQQSAGWAKWMVKTDQSVILELGHDMASL